MVGQEVTSHTLVGMPISMVRGRGTGYPLRPAQRRVDNLRTEWLSIYLFLVVGLPCSGAGKSLKDVGTLEPPMDPTRHSCPTNRVCNCPQVAPGHARGGPARDLVRGAVLKKGRGRRQRKKESSSKGLREKQAQKHQQNYTSTSNTHNIQPPCKPLTKITTTTT